jgi:hypothetical protein
MSIQLPWIFAILTGQKCNNKLEEFKPQIIPCIVIIPTLSLSYIRIFKLDTNTINITHSM